MPFELVVCIYARSKVGSICETARLFVLTFSLYDCIITTLYITGHPMTLPNDNLLACSWGDYKQRCLEFMQIAPTMNEEELDRAMACVTLGYLNLDELMWQSSAVILLEMVTRSRLAREFELQQG